MNAARRQDFSQEYSAAYQEFVKIRREESRISACGQRFILVDNVTKRLKQRSPSCHISYENDLDRLRQTAYLQSTNTPPLMPTEHFDEHLCIFYTLLDMNLPHLVHEFWEHGFRDDRLPLRIDTIRNEIKFDNIHNIDGFCQNFWDAQLAWCPIRLEMDMGQNYQHRVSPFYRKEKIKPYRDGKGPSENTASLYAIEVPEEFVGSRLRERMRSAKIERQELESEDLRNKGLRYRFALKQFTDDKRHHFTNEKRMFMNLKDKEGMVQYIGWYESYELVELDASGPKQWKQYCNIILELADFDFYTAIRKESPPIFPHEIFGFWDSMFDISKALTSIHTVDRDGKTWVTWHGDIKPENILRVEDRFKLADPGEARIQLSEAGAGPQKAKITGGTRTYAAPEKSAYLDGRSSQKPEVTQTSDVWSLGCVLSMAATYVVLGTQGVLIFNRVRRQAIFTAGASGDAFHDGHKVLVDVTDWHKYVRGAARLTDAHTGAVLNMVDDHMLVPADKRWTAQQVCDEFERIFAEIPQKQSGAPDRIEVILQNIDDQVEIKYEEHSGFKRVDSDDVAKRLQPSLPPPIVESDFKSRQALLEQEILPTAQRSQNRTGSSQTGWRPSFSLNARTDAPRVDTDMTAFSSDSLKRVSKAPNQLRDITPLPDIERHITREPVTYHQVKQELQNSAMSYEPSVRSFSSLFKKKPISMKGHEAWKTKQDHLDDRLTTEFQNRDIVYLVDNGSSMHRHWGEATTVLEVLVWRSLNYDDNGMELFFTDPDTDSRAVVKESRDQKLEEFVRTMGFAKPKAEGEDAVQTTILPELERIINRYVRAKASKSRNPRKLTIIVLTDGVWSGMHMENTLDVYLKSTFHHLRDLHRDLPNISLAEAHTRQGISEIRPVTIQFVRFGNNLNAIERLRRLDDDLKHYGCPDLIDTEPAAGDVYKIFLGSLCNDIDHRTSLVLSLPPSSPLNNRNPANSSPPGSSIGGRITDLSDNTPPMEALTPAQTGTFASHQGAEFSNYQMTSSFSQGNITAPYETQLVPYPQSMRRTPSPRSSSYQSSLHRVPQMPPTEGHHVDQNFNRPDITDQVNITPQSPNVSSQHSFPYSFR